MLRTLLIIHLLAPQLEFVAAGAAAARTAGASVPGAGNEAPLLSLEDLDSPDNSTSSVFAIPDALKSKAGRWGKQGRRKPAASPEAEFKFKSNAEWWKDPLSHFDDKGNEITGKSKAPAGRVNPLAIVAPAMGKVAATIVQHPVIFAASVAIIVFSQLDNSTYQQMLSGVRRFKEKVVSSIRSRGAAHALEPSESIESSSPVTSTKASRNASRSGIFGSKTKTKKVDSETLQMQTEAEMRGLLARAISAEKEQQNAEQKHDILQSQLKQTARELDKVLSSNADLHAHLQATQRVSADVQLLNDKIDKLAIYIGRQMQAMHANGGSTGTGQRNIPRYGR